jgi:hypothetical protein
MLQAALGHCGLEVLGYEGPARYEVGRVVQCEICEDLVTVEDTGYELRLRSKVWGATVWVCPQGCFERATVAPQIIIPFLGFAVHDETYLKMKPEYDGIDMYIKKN